MKLQQRIDLLSRLGEHLLSGDTLWQQAKERASIENPWFIPQFIDKAVDNIVYSWLRKDILEKWTSNLSERSPLDEPRTSNPIAIGFQPRTVGIVMAGNIPLVGFHDMLSVFISGHRALIKPSSRDKVLITHIVDTMKAWEPGVEEWISFAERLKGADAYITTGSNNSARHFEYYFRNHPHIIRRNRTSVAILTGEETAEELQLLADDVHLYFGLGCRNVTKIYVPRNYDFVPLLVAFKKYKWLADHHKYRNNLDYNLALHILNRKLYMSNESLLLVEDTSLFSPISQLNYEFYSNRNDLVTSLQKNEDLQCIVGRDFTPFGRAQCPAVTDYADGVNTLKFLLQMH
jgi:hypothetical protein